MIGPKEKKERALGMNLNLKGERCASPKCAFIRKPYKPGMHGPRGRRKTLSEFGLQLKEKQKFKISYGLDERNLRQLVLGAKKAKGSSAAKIVEFLERRLDNVVYRLGFASSRASARQLVSHGHILVHDKKVRSPSYQVKVGEVIKVNGDVEVVVKKKDVLKKYDPPSWLHLDAEKLEGRILSLPQDVTLPFEVNLLVESFSK